MSVGHNSSLSWCAPVCRCNRVIFVQFMLQQFPNSIKQIISLKKYASLSTGLRAFKYLTCFCTGAQVFKFAARKSSTYHLLYTSPKFHCVDRGLKMKVISGIALLRAKESECNFTMRGYKKNCQEKIVIVKRLMIRLRLFVLTHAMF